MSKIRIVATLVKSDFELISEDSQLRSSDVWRYFGRLKSINPEQTIDQLIPIDSRVHKFSAKEIVFCNECFAINNPYLRGVHKFSPNTSTTILRLHLINHHQMRNLINSNLQEIARNEKGQFYLSCVLMCCVVNLQINILKNEGLQLMLDNLKQIVSTNYSINLDHLILPSSSHVTNNLLPKVHLFCKNFIAKFIKKNFLFGCLGIDMWQGTILNNNRYIAFNLFFLDSNLKMQKILLDFAPLNISHTSQNLLDKINETLAFYQLDQNKLFFITDQGANIVAATSGFDNHQLCLQHGIPNLVLVDAIKSCRSNENSLVKVIKKTKSKLYNSALII